MSLAIEPDVEIVLSDEQGELLAEDRTLIGTESDPQFSEALEILKDEIRANRDGNSLTRMSEE